MGRFDADVPDILNARFVGLHDNVLSGWFNVESGELFRGFKVDAADVFLDVGCGEGASSIFAAQRGAHVIITDTEAQPVDDLRRRIENNTPARKLEAYVGNSNPLPMPNGYANKIVCLEVLEHLETPEQLLQELYRVGTPGARYLISVPGARSERIQQHTAPAAYFQSPNHLHIFERDDFIALVERAGLVVDEHHQSGFFWVLLMNIYWAIEAAEGRTAEGAVRDKLETPFDPNLDRLSAIWLKLIKTPQGRAFKREMDNILPKSQLVLAHKPT